MPPSSIESMLVHIRKYFRPLEKKEAKVIYAYIPPKNPEGFVIVLECVDFRMRFSQEHSTIHLEIGTLQAEPIWQKSSGGLWFDLIDIVMYFSQKQLLITGYWEYQFNPEKQFEMLAEAFFHYYDAIADLYQPEKFLVEKENLNQVYQDGLALASDYKRKAELTNLERKSQKFWQK
jgi:hypothetical protein